MTFSHVFGKSKKQMAGAKAGLRSILNLTLLRVLEIAWHCLVTLAGLSIVAVVIGVLFLIAFVALPCAVLMFVVELMLDGRASWTQEIK